MATQLTGQLRSLSGLTERDLVVATLLGMDEILSALREDPERPRLHGHSATPEALVDLLSNLMLHGLDCIPDHAEFVRLHGYGLPGWLSGAPDSPVRVLEEQLTSPTAKGALWKIIKRKNEEVDLGALLDFSTALGSGERAASPAEGLRKLRDQTMVVDGRLVPATALSAQSDPAASARSTREIARLAALDRDQCLAEQGWRLLRIDFPLVVRHRLAGVLMGAEVRFDDPGKSEVTIRGLEQIAALLDPHGAVLKSWRLADQEFTAGVRNGAAAAVQLLERLGFGKENAAEYARPRLFLRGLLPPSELTGASIALPLALEIVRQAFDLPPTEWVASGDISREGELLPLRPDTVAIKLQAVKADGVKAGLLAAADPGEEPGEPDVIRLGKGERTLFAAAQRMWGEEWRRRVHDRKAKILRGHGFAQGWPEERSASGATFRGTPIVVKTSQAERLAQDFREGSGQDLIFLGGPPQTGKSWIAREVQELLEADHNWRVVVLSLLPEHPLSSEDVRASMKAALDFLPQTNRRLVIIEGLEAMDNLGDVGNVLRHAAAQERVSILAIVRLDGGPPWSPNAFTTVNPIANEESIQEFVSRVVETLPQSQALTDLAATIRQGASGDLWWLVNLLALAAEGALPVRYPELLRTYLERRLAGVTPAQLDALQMLASMSLCSVYVPARQLEDLDEVLLRRVGAKRVDTRGWLIPSRANCRALLQARSQPGRITMGPEPKSEIQSKFVERFIRGAIGAGAHGGDAHAILAGLEKVKQHAPVALSKFIVRGVRELVDWGTREAEPAQLARLIGAIAPDLLWRQDLEDLVGRLVNLVSTDMDEMTSRGLSQALQVLRWERSFIPNHADWRRLLDRLESRLGNVLWGNEQPAEALAIQLWMLHEPSAHRALFRNAELFFNRKLPYLAQDYALALRFLGYAEVGLEDDQVEGPAVRAAIDACRKVAESDPGPDAARSADVFLTRLALRLKLGLEEREWQVLLDRIGRQLEDCVQSSSVMQLSQGLHAIADQNRAFAVRLLVRCKIKERFLARARVSTPGESATLISLVASLHADAAHQMLYDGEKPREVLAGELAWQVKSRGDPRAAGRLLQAAGRVDALFGSVVNGFARRLAERIGKDFVLHNLQTDPRISVIDHLMRGLIAAEVPFAEEAWQAVCRVASESISLSFRSWAPHLALLMCESEAVGAEFSKTFREAVPSSRILEGMLTARDVEAVEYFHRLGRLYGDVPARFGQEYHRGPAALVPRMMREDRAEVILRAVQAVADTLRRSGEPGAGRVVLGALGSRWEEESLKRSPPGTTATIINHLLRIDREKTRERVTRPQVDTILRHQMKRMAATPSLGVELLVAVEQAAPSRGKQLLRWFQQQRSWRQFLEGITHDQNPRTQGQALLNLSRLGFHPLLQKQTNLIEKVWADRLDRLGSPGALSTLLRVFAAWDEDRGRQAARRLDIGCVGRRLEQGSAMDLEGAAAIIGSLFALGAEGSAQDLADRLGRVKNLESRVPLGSWPKLLSVLSLAHPELARTTSAKLAARIGGGMLERAIRDDVALWDQIGWIAYYGRQLLGDDYRLELPEPPASFQIPKDPGTRLWATSWLTATQWVKEERERAVKQLLARPSDCAHGMRLPSLIALAPEARCGQLLSAVGADWDPTLRTHPARLLVALRRGPPESAFRSWLRERRETVKTALGFDWLRADPFVAPALALLSQLEPAPGAS